MEQKKRMKMKLTMAAGVFAICSIMPSMAQTEFIKYGNFDSWIVRHVKESGIIGGQTKELYEVGPSAVWNNNKPYHNQGGSPWGTSNVMAKVCGIVKTNNSIYREKRGNGYCARLETHIEKVKVLGVVNIEVLAAGSVFLGSIPEPITSTSNPMSKILAGMPFTKRPKALCFDYKVKLSGKPDRIRETGFSKVTKVSGMDMPDVICLLQKRWEDSKGNVYAKRVGTMVHRFNRTTNWVNNAQFEILYGDITKKNGYHSYMGLIGGDDTKYCRNSKGKVVPIREVGWADADETPTHMVLQFDSSYGGAYVGAVGTTLWIDNVRLVY